LASHRSCSSELQGGLAKAFVAALFAHNEENGGQKGGITKRALQAFVEDNPQVMSIPSLLLSSSPPPSSLLPTLSSSSTLSSPLSPPLSLSPPLPPSFPPSPPPPPQAVDRLGSSHETLLSAFTLHSEDQGGGQRPQHDKNGRAGSASSTGSSDGAAKLGREEMMGVIQSTYVLNGSLPPAVELQVSWAARETVENTPTNMILLLR
jgi:hypothetical protein